MGIEKTKGKLYTVYALCDPRFNNEVRYVGVTAHLTQRMKQHIQPSGLKENHPKNDWLNDLLLEGYRLTVKILQQDVPSIIAEETEDKWIMHYMKEGARLTNKPKRDKGENFFDIITD